MRPFDHRVDRGLVAATGLLAALVLPVAASGQNLTPPLPPPPFVPTPTLLNQSEPCSQYSPTAVTLAGGDVLTIWVDFVDSEVVIAGRRLSSFGIPHGDQTSLLTATGLSIGDGLQLAALPDGGFLILWAGLDLGLGTYRFVLSRFDAAGDQVDEVDVASPTEAYRRSYALAVDALGRPAIAWIDGDRVWLILYDESLEAVTGVRPIGEPEEAAGVLGSVDVARNPNGPIMVVWDEAPEVGPPVYYDRVRGRLFDTDGQAVRETFPVNTIPVTEFGSNLQPTVASLGLGGELTSDRWVAAWINHHSIPEADEGLFAQEFNVGGFPLGPGFQVNDVAVFGVDGPQILPTVDGGYATVWQAMPVYPPVDPLPPGFDPVVRGRRFGLDGVPAGSEFELWSSDLGRWQSSPSVALAAGRLVQVWRDHDLFPPILPPPCPESAKIFAMSTPLGCVPTSDRLCLQDGRFSVQALLPILPPIAPPQTRAAAAEPLTDDTGTFWFFRPENVELMVKVLDGRAINQRFWFFSGAMSNVDYTIEVRDTFTGERRHYSSQQQLVSFADTRFFFDPPPPPFSSRAPAAVTAERTPPQATAAPTHPTLGCDAPSTLCLQGERFQARVEWTDPRTGDSGDGVGVNLTDESGYFWFFRPGNAEMVVKLLDGRLANGYFWAFVGGLTDIQIRLTVEDLFTHATWVYEKPAGSLESAADVRALSDQPCSICSSAAAGGGTQ